MRAHSTSFGGEEDALANRKRSDSEADLDITPMIDVVFLLLIFFMVTSTMQDARKNEPPPAKHGADTDSSVATFILVNRPDDPSAEPVVEFSSGDEGGLDDIKAEVEAGVAQEKFHVIIKADRDVPHGVVKQVMRKAAEVEGVQLFVEVSEKR